MPTDPVRAAVDGRTWPWSHARDNFRGVVTIAVLLLLALGYHAWVKKNIVPHEAFLVRSMLTREGYPGAEVWEDWVACGRGNAGFHWQTATFEGYACSYTTNAKIVRAWPRRGMAQGGATSSPPQ